MVLSRLLDGVHVSKLFMLQYGAMAQTQDVEVHEIRYDSRLVTHGDLFVAIPGTAVNGARYIEEAIQRGAIAVVTQDDTALPEALFLHTRVMKIVVPDARVALAQLATNYYEHPSSQMRVIGVTGTNGKTTTTYLIKAALEARGERVGLIGTIAVDRGGELLPATHTTPESLELQSLLRSMVQRGCTYAVMEVSSHALSMERVHGVRFAAGVFTNLTQDHLDYHGSMDAYLAAKRRLFEMLPADAVAVLNGDDPASADLRAATKARCRTYGLISPADVMGRDITMDMHGMSFSTAWNGQTVRLSSPLTGAFNAANILAAFTVACELGLPPETAAKGLASLQAVRGRFEQLVSPTGWTAVIDYAHTPDALERVLTAIRELLPSPDSKIITVFGCGGNRDKDKRPKMGRIASALSTITVLTSDNPRQEDPNIILSQIQAGVLPGKTVYTEADRRQAIIKGLLLAESGDIVLIAGKGHEDYQVVGTTKSHLDDREEVEMFIRNMK
ncbi:MAG: UDP-N-acetylmuramoyl-L-alanyl-D-glutamate--2,6-diaminopimelate ligase [Bacteroidetes bacterium]|nr:UDP-N-acetylmuramoyl-L-alanyl-D-glutamate--2,6-diaminopimelate ligase [Bacteroidota bacterium]